MKKRALYMKTLVHFLPLLVTSVGYVENCTMWHATLFAHVISLFAIQGLSKSFERFKFGIFYVLIVKIRYNFTHK